MSRPINLTPLLRGVAEPELLRSLADQGRPALESFIEAAIAVLDVIDGDPDIEDATDAEDDFHLTKQAIGYTKGVPGCPVADTDYGIEDQPQDEESDLTPDWGIDQREHIPDAIVTASDREASRPHRDRIRRTRCVPKYVRWYDWSARQERRTIDRYALLLPPTSPTRRQLLKRKRGVPRRPRA
ncbi:hypothetical protein ACIPPQ_20050 [Sphingopyxis sp. LARHCG72]